MNLKKLFNKASNSSKPNNNEFTEGNDYDSFMLSEKYFKRLKEELCGVAYVFISENLNLEIGHDKLLEIVDDFFHKYPQRPILQNVGGSGFHNCFWLYIVTKILGPSLIIESGVWKGQSSWVLREACPDATIHSFDINLKKLTYRSKSINYHEMDWCEFNFNSVDPLRSLCFFDDHINQAKRTREAYDKGFRTLIFDDNPPVHKLFSFGLPGVPTIDMLLDDSIKPGELIEWVWKGEKKIYLYNKEDEYSARELIRKYAVFPDVGGITKYGGYSYLSIVKLID